MANGYSKNKLRSNLVNHLKEAFLCNSDLLILQIQKLSDIMFAIA